MTSLRRNPAVCALVLAALVSTAVQHHPGAALAAGLTSPAASVRTFETETVGQPATGCITPTGKSAAVVTNQRGRSGTRSLWINDRSATAQVVVQCPIAPQRGANLRAAIYPVGLTNGFTASLLGHLQSAPSQTRLAFHLGVVANGAIQWYDGARWSALAPPGTIASGNWQTIALEVPADQRSVTVSVGDRVIGTAQPADPSALIDISGYQFSSSGTAPQGDEVLIDDLTVAEARGFETEPLGGVPVGCGTPSGKQPATVSSTRAGQGSRSLLVDDRSTTTQAVVVCPVAPQRGLDLEFGVLPTSLANGFSFALTGQLEGVAGEPRVVYQVAVFADGSVRWFDWLGWTPLTPPGAVRIGTWSTVRLRIAPDQELAQVLVDGSPVGVLGPVGVRAVANITGYQFASYGTATAGDQVFIDDLTAGAAVPLPPVGGSTLQVGADVTVEHSTGSPLQMPHSAVAIPGTAPEVLTTYAAHGDATGAVGTRLTSSLDGGLSWQRQDARNPLPNEQSYHFTRLRDGTLLAVLYHTFMTPGSQNRKADVVTAISRDQGRNWTHRTGTMTAPQPMRPIDPNSSRPGRTMGGFVLVHNAVEDSDGTLYQSGYGYFEGDPKYRQILLASTDGGTNWSVRATIAVNPSLSTDPRYEGFDEAAIERVADGSLLAVIRTGSFQPMYVSRSTDNGFHWTTPVPLKAGPNGLTVTGVYPTLLAMPNGRLVLSIGRPGQSLLVSDDGSGATWTAPITIDYRNSGNGTIVATGPDRIVALGDRGADWAPVRPAAPRIWSRSVVLDSVCDRTISGRHHGDLEIDTGTVCLDQATVVGSIRVGRQASLISKDSSVTGGVSATQARTLSICGGVVHGSVNITATTGVLMLGAANRGCAAPRLAATPVLTGNQGLVRQETL
ncbi:sialidase family protein [Kribbella sp. NPDC056861]|uniref:sialidase family protein n=1 Tax=Kribbella sp. NPDC056861 TaxID=3154857 RepID=UPI0034369302